MIQNNQKQIRNVETSENMKTIAEMLGVEFYEEFAAEPNTSDSRSRTFRLTEKELEVRHGNGAWTRSKSIFRFLRGDLAVKKLFWKPTFATTYYTASQARCDHSVNRWVWSGSDWDFSNYIIGNCFRTEDEARSNYDKLIGRLKDFYEKSPGICVYG